MYKTRKYHISPPQPCLTPPLRVTRQHFWMKLVQQKLQECTAKTVW